MVGRRFLVPVKKANVLRKAKGEYHHGDLKTSLKQAALRLVQDRGQLVEAGMAYLRFARNHADYFSVMFHSGLDRSKYPDIERSAKAGLGVVLGLAQQYERTQELAELRAVSAWALVHGLATLDHAGALSAAAGMGRALEQFRPILERFVDRPYK